jgi:uncharacterized membrane protein
LGLSSNVHSISPETQQVQIKWSVNPNAFNSLEVGIVTVFTGNYSNTTWMNVSIDGGNETILCLSCASVQLSIGNMTNGIHYLNVTSGFGNVSSNFKVINSNSLDDPFSYTGAITGKVTIWQIYLVLIGLGLVLFYRTIKSIDSGNLNRAIPGFGSAFFIASVYYSIQLEIASTVPFNVTYIALGLLWSVLGLYMAIVALTMKHNVSDIEN